MCTALGFSKDFTAYIRPQQDEVSPLHPVALGENTFHSRGHLPFPIPPDVCVATPTPFARKGFGVFDLCQKKSGECAWTFRKSCSPSSSLALMASFLLVYSSEPSLVSRLPHRTNLLPYSAAILTPTQTMRIVSLPFRSAYYLFGGQ